MNSIKTKFSNRIFFVWFYCNQKLTKSKSRACDTIKTNKQGGFCEPIPSIDHIKEKYRRCSCRQATIKSLLERGETKLQYAGLTYCTNGYKCDQDGLINAAFCTGCDFSLITPDIAKKWQRLHKRCVSHLEFASDCGEVSPVSFAHFVSQIRSAERVMRQCKIEFTPYQEAL